MMMGNRKKMAGRNWEDLDTDCLMNIFGRLDIETRLLDVPFACKHWCQTVLNPFCWKILIFPDDIFESRIKNESGSDQVFKRPKKKGLIKFVVDRSQGCATKIVLPRFTTTAELIYVSDVCPNLRLLSLINVSHAVYDAAMPELVLKWKNLKILEVNVCRNLIQLIDNIGAHCRNFVGLHVELSDIDHQIVLAIVSNIKTLKFLVLDCCEIQKADLVLILEGCKELEVLHIWGYRRFDKDYEILKLVSRIRDFRCHNLWPSMYDCCRQNYVCDTSEEYFYPPDYGDILAE